MSEKIYSWLLWLYPARFRSVYGQEALQLFRDRVRDEQGFFPRLRLWLDLLWDLAVSLPLEYRRAQRALVTASVPQALDGTPSFSFLPDNSPRATALLLGGVVSVLAISGCLTVLSYVINHAEAKVIQPVRFTSRSSGFASQSSPAATPGSTSPVTATPAIGKLDAAERHRVIDGAVANLKQYYPDPDLSQKMGDALRQHEINGEDDAATDEASFARLLTRQMRDVSHDMHLDLAYSPSPLPDHPPQETPERLQQYRLAMQQTNCTFEKVEILPHNIGYLMLNSFPDPAVCKSTAVAAMHRLNHVNAIIFDLRDNRGGQPEMVALIATYLFDHPVYFYNPRENTSQRSWTQSPVPGSKLGDKPVYILTSHQTMSGAEQFCYNLKMLKRATLIGETTAGAAHAGVWRRIDEHFGMGIPETKPINPFGNSDWAEVGVEPDIKVPAGDALQTAEKLAQTNLKRTR